MVVMAPANENECRRMLQTAYEYSGPAIVRYPRGSGPGVAVDLARDKLPLGRGELCREGDRIALLAFGNILDSALQAAETLGASVANMRFIKPLDQDLILLLAERHELLVTLEENALQGGAGSAVNELLNQLGRSVRLLNLGLPDAYLEHASQADQLAEAGLDPSGIVTAVQQAVQEPPLRVLVNRSLI
jgi:1-deoxy-D-xylulose-5-phosphate synthase